MKKSKTAKSKKSPAQLLGLERQKMTPRTCRSRAKLLLDRVERGYYKGEVAKIAKAWAYKYRSHANRLEAA